MNLDELITNATDRIARELMINPAMIGLRSKVELIMFTAAAALTRDPDQLAHDLIIAPSCKAMGELINALLIDADINTLPSEMITSLLIEVIDQSFA